MKAFVLGTIDEAPLCGSIADVYRYPARRTLARVLRPWWDDLTLIPLEVLHRPLLLAELEAEGTLFARALERLATAQARASGTPVEARADELRHIFRSVQDLAQRGDALESWGRHLRLNGIDSLIAQANATLPETERDRAVTFALAEWLGRARDWPGKLDTLCDLLERAESPAGVTCLDECIAETLDGSTPALSILGQAPDLAAALDALAKLSAGTLDPVFGRTLLLERLNGLIDKRSLPATRAVLHQRIARLLESAAPLTRSGRGSDVRAFRELLPLLRETGGFRGRGPMSVAVTRRAQTSLGAESGELPAEEAITLILETLPDPGTRVGYLLDLLGTGWGKKRSPVLLRRLAMLFTSVHSLRDFFAGNPEAWTPETVRDTFRARLHDGGIRGELADLFMQRLEQMARIPAVAAPDVPAAPGMLPVPACVDPAEVQTVCYQIRVLADPSPVKGPHVVLYHQGREYVLDRSSTEFVLGRGPDCDLRIDARTASRRHAIIRNRQGEFVLVDRSRNGTYVRPGIQKPVVLQNGSLSLTGTGTIYLGASPDAPEAEKRHLILYQQFPGR